LVVKFPLYNRIRALKRKLTASEAKLKKISVQLKKVQKAKKVQKTKPIEKKKDISNEDIDTQTTTSKDLTAFKTLVQHIAQAPKKVQISLLQGQENAKKSRIASHLAPKVGLNRKSILCKRKQSLLRRIEFNKEKASVVTFLKKPQNSTPLPGKRDQIGNGKQRYSLSDTMSNLHKAYRLQNPSSKISLATFCRQRPANMKTIQWADRRQCLCVHHQNGVLKLKALHKNISISRFLQENATDDITSMLVALPEGNIRFREWQKEEVAYQGTTLKKLRLQQLELSKDDFSAKFQDEFQDLRKHVHRMKTQYEELDRLRKNLEPLKHVTCQIDYSENYGCSFQDEPSQVFYDRRQVTIHPMVIHFRDEQGSLQHHSFVGISPERSHSAPTTFAFVRKLIPKVVEFMPQVDTVHYISDSPVSQYRNRSIIKVVAQHEEYFNGIKATWDYLESGHGKGPCDGVGGSIKRSADIAVKKGEIISNAEEFFQWASTNSTNISCLYVSNADVSIADRMLANAGAFKGLSKCHSVRPYNGFIWIKETSCYKECCAEVPTCTGWEKTTVTLKQNVKESTSKDNPQQHEPEKPVVNYVVGNIVEAMYNNKMYRGEIIEYDEENNDFNIKFMKKNKDGRYIWSKANAWSTWVLAENIVKIIQ
jgi:hypothetical protein